MAENSGCPLPENLSRIKLDPTLDPNFREELQKHLAGCKACQRTLRVLLVKQVQDENMDPVPAKESQSSSLAKKQKTETQSKENSPNHSPESEVPVAKLIDPSNPYPFMDPPEAEGEMGWISNYRVFRVIGTGGMGVVFEAEDKDLRRRIALKILRTELVDDNYKQRFLQEARLAGNLQSEHIVTVFRVGEWTGPDAQTVPFLSMEFLHGETLEAKLGRDTLLPSREALGYIRQVAEGLNDAHQSNLIHRDIKPANIWIEVNPNTGEFRRVKILDFGLAKPVNQDSSLTHHGMVVGTPSYMAPEQIYGLPCDQRTDLYGLGCLLFKCLCGKTPFEGENTMAVLRATVEAEAPDLEAAGKTLPRDILKLLEDLLAKDPDKRLPTAKSVIARIDQILGDRRGSGQRYLDPKMGVSGGSGHGGSAEHKAPQKRFLAIGASIFVMILAVTYPMINLILKWANPPVVEALPKVKIGLLFSKTGNLEAMDKPLLSICKAAFKALVPDNILLGNQLTLVEHDAKSSPSENAKGTVHLLDTEKVSVIFGCSTPPFRRRSAEVLFNYNGLLFYPGIGEGMDNSPGVIHMGPIPNQLLEPVLEYSLKFGSKKGLIRKVFMVGTDDVSSRSIVQYTKMIMEKNYVNTHTLVGSDFLPLVPPYSHVERISEAIALAKPDFVVSTIGHSGAIAALVNELRKKGFTSEKLPMIHLVLDEVKLEAIDRAHKGLLNGDYAVANYFMNLRTPANEEFLATIRNQLGENSLVSDSMVKAYTAINLWIQAVKKAKSFEVDLVLHSLHEDSWESPAGVATILPNNYTQFRVRIAQVREQGLVITNESTHIPPDIFPHFVHLPQRSRDQQITAMDRWLTMTRLLESGYQENDQYSEWENNTNPKPLDMSPNSWWNQIK